MRWRLLCTIAALMAVGCSMNAEEELTHKSSELNVVTVESLVGDKDGFGVGIPCGSSYQDANAFNPGPDDPPGTDVVVVTSAYTPPLSMNPYITNPRALKPPAPFVHTFNLRQGCPITSAELEMCTADVDDGPLSWVDDQLFLDGNELPGAFDDVDQLISGPAGYAGVVRFNLPPSAWGLLADGRLSVQVDELGRTTTNASISEALAFDYSQLRIHQACPDNQPPDCSAAHASPPDLWPPNHEMRPVDVLGVNDPDGDTLTLTVTRITQDEPVDEKGDGATAPDGAGVGTAIAFVRAERAGPRNGRVYGISFRADDGRGGSCTGSVSVCVPHDQGAHAECVDDGQIYDSTLLE
jgi:hypothetical protein